MLTRGFRTLTLALGLTTLAACGGGGGGDDGGGGGGTDGTDAEYCAARIEDARTMPQIDGCPDPQTGVAAPLSPHLPIEGINDTHPLPGHVHEDATHAQVSHWSDVVSLNPGGGVGHLPIHSVHRPTGKFLQFGAHEVPGNFSAFEQDEFVWYPPAPCEPLQVGVENCDTEFDRYPNDPVVDDAHADVHLTSNGEEIAMFCAGHVNIPA